MSILSAPHFHDEEAAFAKVEALLWPNGPVCPHCGGTDRIGVIKANPEKRVRHGLKKCGDCKGQFTVRMGTIFEESKLPLHIWLQAIHLMCSSKKGVSAHQLHRTLEVTYKTAWFLAHRIRAAMAQGSPSPFGGGGTPVEVDETYIGRDNANPQQTKHRRTVHMNKVVTLVDRASGRASSTVVENVTIAEIRPILEANVSREARLMTDDARWYKRLGLPYAEHGVVNHSKEEYVSLLDRTIHTNTVEGYFSIFKRGMKGVYQHCSSKHLHRYMAEFDFRYSNRVALGVHDQERAALALIGAKGKRLTYRGGADKRPEN